MTIGTDILALEDITEYIDILIIIALVVIGAIGGAIQRSAKKQQERRAEEARRRGPQKPQQPAGSAKAQQPQRAQETIDDLARAARQVFGIEQEASARAKASAMRQQAKGEPARRTKKPAGPQQQPEPPTLRSARHKAQAKLRRPVAYVDTELRKLHNIEEARRAII
ncbi:MAG: hypothetical protein ACYTF6_09015, partial [Planctomycetota bacterium]